MLMYATPVHNTVWDWKQAFQNVFQVKYFYSLKW